jgi:lysophospholipase L1-like esterase
MPRSYPFLKTRRIVALLALVISLQAASQGQTARPRRIAVFGSSVAFGTGDEYGKEGNTGMLREMLAPKGWEVLNQSRGGDSTLLLAKRWAPEGAPDPKTRYLLPVNPGYVVISLSLANEGIFEADPKKEKDEVFQQYADGIKGFVAKARQQNIVPIVTLCYPRSVYTSVEYEYIRRMNILLNSWDVPAVNFLGALDDGAGRWAKGFMFNDKHPNASGHRELATTFVPTLFDALEKGKPTPVKATGARGFARISGGTAPLTFEPDSMMHPFAISMMVRTESDGTIAAISGSTLEAKTTKKSFGTGPAATDFEEATLVADQPFTLTIGAQNGKWTYKSAAGTYVTSNVSADTQWHQIVVSHYTARGETFFFVDGKLAGTVNERLEPNRFLIGGAETGQADATTKQLDLRDVFVFRSALNADEVAVLNQGKMLQASLEIYSPLDDAKFRPDTIIGNNAQSMTGLKVGSGHIIHVAENAHH